jgi:gamma-glutamyltranspeptidase
VCRRIDYSLRAALIFKEIDNSQYFLDNLIVENKQWVFKNFESAKKFAEVFKKLNDYYYAGLLSAAMFKLWRRLKYALEKGYISETDLYGTDIEYWRR